MPPTVCKKKLLSDSLPISLMSSTLNLSILSMPSALATLFATAAVRTSPIIVLPT
jgi:hypothetical protein